MAVDLLDPQDPKVQALLQVIREAQAPEQLAGPQQALAGPPVPENVSTLNSAENEKQFAWEELLGISRPDAVQTDTSIHPLKRIGLALAAGLQAKGGNPNPTDFVGQIMDMRRQQADEANAAADQSFEDQRDTAFTRLQAAEADAGEARRVFERDQDIANRQSEIGRAERFDRETQQTDAENALNEAFSDLAYTIDVSGFPKTREGLNAARKQAGDVERGRAEKAARLNDDKDAMNRTDLVIQEVDGILEGVVDPVTGATLPGSSAADQIRAARGDRKEQASILAGARARLETLKRRPGLTQDGREYIQSRIDELMQQARAVMVDTSVDTGGGGDDRPPGILNPTPAPIARELGGNLATVLDPNRGSPRPRNLSEELFKESF